MRVLRDVLPAVTSLTLLFVSGCSADDGLPTSPTPPVTANVFILPDAGSLGDRAFGDEPIVIFQGERMHVVNADTLTHEVVADSPGATDFRTTGKLGPGGQRLFTMTTLGTTGIHCDIHPNETGTLIVREH